MEAFSPCGILFSVEMNRLFRLEPDDIHLLCSICYSYESRLFHNLVAYLPRLAFGDLSYHAYAVHFCTVSPGRLNPTFFRYPSSTYPFSFSV